MTTTETQVQPPQMFGSFKVRDAHERTNLGETILLYSAGGGGKTTLAASMIELGPVVFFDAEGGTKVVSDIEGVKVVEMNSWADIKKMRDTVLQTPNIPWKTIVLDNLSEYIQLCVASTFGGKEASGTGYDPRWGTVIGEVIGLVRDYRNFANKSGINVIILAWDSVEIDEQTKRRVAKLSATPKLQELLPGIVDIIGYISPVRNRQDLRRVTFEVRDDTQTKFRRNRSDAAMAIPLLITYGLDNLPLGDIVKTIRDGVPFPVDKYKTPANLTA